MQITSIERRLEVGAVQFTAVLTKSGFKSVSEIKAAEVICNDSQVGEKVYSLEAPIRTCYAFFSRSSSGKECVTIFINDKEVANLNSFELAQQWAEQKLSSSAEGINSFRLYLD